MPDCASTDQQHALPELPRLQLDRSGTAVSQFIAAPVRRGEDSIAMPDACQQVRQIPGKVRDIQLRPGARLTIGDTTLAIEYQPGDNYWKGYQPTACQP